MYGVPLLFPCLPSPLCSLLLLAGPLGTAPPRSLTLPHPLLPFNYTPLLSSPFSSTLASPTTFSHFSTPSPPLHHSFSPPSLLLSNLSALLHPHPFLPPLLHLSPQPLLYSFLNHTPYSTPSPSLHHPLSPLMPPFSLYLLSNLPTSNFLSPSFPLFHLLPAWPALFPTAALLLLLNKP